MKKIINIVLILSIFSLVGCSSNNENTSNSKETKIKIGILPSLSSVPYLYALEEGMYKKAGLDVEFVTFRSAIERDAALKANELQGVSTDMLAIAFYKQDGLDMVVTSKTEEIFRLVANSDYTKQLNSTTVDLKQTNNAKVGISERTVIEYLMDQLQIENNITYKKLPFPKVPDRKAALDAKQIDMAIMPEPFPSLVVQTGGSEIWKNEINDSNVTIMAFRKDFTTKNSDALKKFHQITNEAINSLQTKEFKDYQDIVVKHGILTEKDLSIVPPQKYSELVPPSEETFQQVMDWMLAKGYIKQSYQLKDFQFNW